METGEIDLIHGTASHGRGQISLDAFERFTTMPDYVTQISQPLASRVVAINSKRGPTAELAVRQAIQHAVNKAALVKAIFYGVEQQADTLYPADTPYCDLGLKAYAFDQATAAKMLDEAGWRQKAAGETRTKEGQELAIDFCFVGNDAQQKAIAEVIRGDLQKIGIKINMIGEALLSTDETKRQELYRYILTNLHEQAVYLPLTYVRGVIVHKKNLKGARYGQLKSEIPFELIERQ